MWVIYTGDDGNSQEWSIDLDQVGDNEAEMIERRCGFDWTEYRQRLLKGNRACRRALLWTLLRREHHTIRYEDVRFTDATLVVEFDQDELGRIIAEVEKLDDLTEAQRDALSAMKAALAQARPGPGKAGAPKGA